MTDPSTTSRGLRSTLDRLRTAIASALTPERVGLLLFFVVNLVLISPYLMPQLNSINPNDEAKYIESGRRLVIGSFRGLEWSPLSSFLYAPLYLIVQHSLDWFLELTSLGRFALFGILWTSMMVLAHSLRRFISPMILAGLILVETTFTTIVSNPSDALFASMSTLALAMLFDYDSSGRPVHLLMSSVFMGLAILSRNDGWFLLPAFLLTAAYLIRKKRINLSKAFVLTVLPAVLIVGAYVGILAGRSGHIALGTSERGYSAYIWSLENNLGISDSQLQAQLGSGTQESQSVARAMLSNPSLLFRQVRHNLAGLPSALLAAYDKRVGGAFFLLCLIGLYALYARRAFLPLAVLSAWPLHSLLYLAFYLRPGFLLLDLGVMFALAAIGTSFLVTVGASPRQLFFRSAPFAALALAGLLFGKLALLPAGLLPLAAVWIAWLFRKTAEPALRSSSFQLMALLAAGLILHGSFPFPNYPDLSSSPSERAVRFLELNLDPGTKVVASTLLPGLASRMEPVLWSDVNDQVRGTDALMTYLQDNGVSTLYITPDFIQAYPSLWDDVQAIVANHGQRVFVGDPGSIQIFFTRPGGTAP